MEIRLTIGDFSRMTHLSIKALRHYHDLGLLDPVDVDPQSGYRFYSAGQVPTAQVIRRFRALGMPVEHIRAVVDAPDLASRNAIILEHLKHMERQLEQTQETVASLRALLERSARLDRSVVVGGVRRTLPRRQCEWARTRRARRWALPDGTVH